VRLTLNTEGDQFSRRGCAHRRERVREVRSGIVSYAADEAAGLAVFALSGELWTVSGAAPERGLPLREGRP